ncbi:MAG: hypothetical protein AMDU1_APLC00030G0010 [Thermoplasmatales archaeon A-plasma]|jgi:hypothetical protein|nr:MAG: hypothetical protein AMDU1_APLC00030G0010 [Thermoplasmatales archaeon A-plasma]
MASTSNIRIGLEYTKRISIGTLKHDFAKKYPNSIILPIILSLPDEISGAEIVGATAILLDLLDMETHNKLGGEL